jgi:hypothetical protein
MSSRNQREGRYVGRLAASIRRDRPRIRSRLGVEVGPDGAMIALLHRTVSLVRTPTGPGWQMRR